MNKRIRKKHRRLAVDRFNRFMNLARHPPQPRWSSFQPLTFPPPEPEPIDMADFAPQFTSFPRSTEETAARALRWMEPGDVFADMRRVIEEIKRGDHDYVPTPPSKPSIPVPSSVICRLDPALAKDLGLSPDAPKLCLVSELCLHHLMTVAAQRVDPRDLDELRRRGALGPVTGLM